MKHAFASILATALALSPAALGQAQLPGGQGQPVRSLPSRSLPRSPQTQTAAEPNAPELTRFDLDFPGGAPSDLVQAIEKASGKPLNIVIPIEAASVPLPPLKMRLVTVPELFGALQQASAGTGRSRARIYESRSRPGVRQYNWNSYLNYMFQTADRPPRDDSVWTFSAQIAEEPKACRFWQLEPYLTEYTVDDITTAIETGYRMLGDSAPTINFHKDTKLLIAVGEESKLALIDAVLQQLTPKAPKAAASKQPGKTGEGPKAAEPKTE